MLLFMEFDINLFLGFFLIGFDFFVNEDLLIVDVLVFIKLLIGISFFGFIINLLLILIFLIEIFFKFLLFKWWVFCGELFNNDFSFWLVFLVV